MRALICIIILFPLVFGDTKVSFSMKGVSDKLFYQLDKFSSELPLMNSDVSIKNVESIRLIKVDCFTKDFIASSLSCIETQNIVTTSIGGFGFTVNTMLNLKKLSNSSVLSQYTLLLLNASPKEIDLVLFNNFKFKALKVTSRPNSVDFNSEGALLLSIETQHFFDFTKIDRKSFVIKATGETNVVVPVIVPVSRDNWLIFTITEKQNIDPSSLKIKLSERNIQLFYFEQQPFFFVRWRSDHSFVNLVDYAEGKEIQSSDCSSSSIKEILIKIEGKEFNSSIETSSDLKDKILVIYPSDLKDIGISRPSSYKNEMNIEVFRRKESFVFKLLNNESSAEFELARKNENLNFRFKFHDISFEKEFELSSLGKARVQFRFLDDQNLKIIPIKLEERTTANFLNSDKFSFCNFLTAETNEIEGHEVVFQYIEGNAFGSLQYFLPYTTNFENLDFFFSQNERDTYQIILFDRTKVLFLYIEDSGSRIQFSFQSKNSDKLDFSKQHLNDLNWTKQSSAKSVGDIQISYVHSTSLTHLNEIKLLEIEKGKIYALSSTPQHSNVISMADTISPIVANNGTYKMLIYNSKNFAIFSRFENEFKINYKNENYSIKDLTSFDWIHYHLKLNLSSDHCSSLQTLLIEDINGDRTNSKILISLNGFNIALDRTEVLKTINEGEIVINFFDHATKAFGGKDRDKIFYFPEMLECDSKSENFLLFTLKPNKLEISHLDSQKIAVYKTNISSIEQISTLNFGEGYVLSLTCYPLKQCDSKIATFSDHSQNLKNQIFVEDFSEFNQPFFDFKIVEKELAISHKYKSGKINLSLLRHDLLFEDWQIKIPISDKFKMVSEKLVEYSKITLHLMISNIRDIKAEHIGSKTLSSSNLSENNLKLNFQLPINSHPSSIQHVKTLLEERKNSFKAAYFQLNNSELEIVIFDPVQIAMGKIENSKFEYYFNPATKIKQRVTNLLHIGEKFTKKLPFNQLLFGKADEFCLGKVCAKIKIFSDIRNNFQICFIEHSESIELAFANDSNKIHVDNRKIDENVIEIANSNKLKQSTKVSEKNQMII